MDPEFNIPEDILDAAVAATPEEINLDTVNILDLQNHIQSLANLNTPEPVDNTATSTCTVPEELVEVENINPITARFSGASWYKKFQELEIVLAGVGGIGSYVAFMLSRMQPAYLTLIDPDRVELVNLAGQLFSSENIGKLKVDAIASLVRNYSQYYALCTITERFDKEHAPLAPVMICGFDNMEARKDFFEAWEGNLPNVDESKAIFIDGRLSAEAFQVITITGDNKTAIEKYKKDFLFTDNEADTTVCSYKQTTYMAAMIASTILNTLTNWVATLAGEFRPVPFFVEYDATIMDFKIIM